MRISLTGFLLNAWLILSQCAFYDSTDTGRHVVHLSGGDLEIDIVDNTAVHPGRKDLYNGVAVMKHAALDTNLFRWNAAGLNHEHIFDGQKWDRKDTDREKLYEPRYAPMDLTRRSKTTAVLHQPPTLFWRLESTTTFTVVPPHYLDMTYECTTHEDIFERGYIGLFWASYIQTSGDPQIYYIGVDSVGAAVRWIGNGVSRGGNTVRYVRERRSPEFRKDYADLMYTRFASGFYAYPFYYGRFEHMVYIIMFDRTEGIRFSNGVNPKGNYTNAAWDWQFFIFDYEVNRTYEYSARIVYKPFIDRSDVIREYEKWSGNQVIMNEK